MWRDNGSDREKAERYRDGDDNKSRLHFLTVLTLSSPLCRFPGNEHAKGTHRYKSRHSVILGLGQACRMKV